MLPGIGVFGLLLITVPGAIPIPSSRMTLTLYTTRRTWNEARLICEALGGHLLFMKDEETEAAVRNFVSGVWETALGGYSESFHLGLFNKGVSPSVMTWLDCEELGTLQYWRGSSEPRDPDEKPCVEYKTNSWGSSVIGWETVACYEQEKFVCETFGGSCEYDQVNATRGVDNSHDLGAVSLGTCQSWCDTTVSQDMECWAFSWSASSCMLHFAPSSSYFNVTQHAQPAADVILYIKRCIVGHVDDSTLVTADMEVTRPFSTCPETHNPGNGDGKVYTLFDVNMTWPEAAQTCNVIGQQLLVVEDAEESLRVHEMYGASSTSIWLGLNGSDTAGLYWVDGSGFTWDNLEVGHPPPGGSVTVCGVEHPTTDTWTTRDCGEQLPFVCQRTGGPCLYERLSSTEGEGGEEQGTASRLECETLCDGTPNCVGYTTYYKFLTLKCRLHISTDPLYLFDPSHYSGSLLKSLYRKTCYTGATLQELPESLGILQGVNVSSLSESSSISSATSSTQTMSTSPLEVSAGTTPSVVITESIVVTSPGTIGFVDISEFPLEASPGTTAFVGISESPLEASQGATAFVSISESTFSSSVLLSSGTSQLLSTETPVLPTTSTTHSEVAQTSTPLQNSSSVSDPIPDTVAASREILSTSLSFQTSLEALSMLLLSTSVQATTIMSVPSPIQASLSLSSSLAVQELVTTPSSGNTESGTSSRTNSYIDTISTSASIPTLTPSTTSQLASASAVSEDTTQASSSIETQTPSDIRVCPCKCYTPTSEEETEQLVQEIRTKLLLEKSELTREIRRRTSAPDVRPSAQNMGVVAITFLCLTLGLALLADMALLYTHLRMLLWNLFALKPTEYR